MYFFTFGQSLDRLLLPPASSHAKAKLIASWLQLHTYCMLRSHLMATSFCCHSQINTITAIKIQLKSLIRSQNLTGHRIQCNTCRPSSSNFKGTVLRDTPTHFLAKSLMKRSMSLSFLYAKYGARDRKQLANTTPCTTTTDKARLAVSHCLC